MGGIRTTPDNNDIVVWKLDEASAPFVNSSTSSNAISTAVSNINTLSGTVALQQPTLFSGSGANTGIWFTGNRSSSPRNFISGASGVEPAFPVTVSGWTYIRVYAPSGFRWNVICKQNTAGVWSGVTFSSFVIQNRTYAGLSADFDVGFAVPGSQSPSSSNGIPVNQWAHLGVTYDGVNQKFYVNGNLVFTIPATGAIGYGGHGPWFFGAIPSGSGDPEECAAGMCDWRIANVARPQSYFQNIYKLGMTTGGQGTPFERYYKLRAYDISCGTAGYWVSNSISYDDAPTAPCSTFGPIEVMESWDILGTAAAPTPSIANALNQLTWLLPNTGNINTTVCSTSDTVVSTPIPGDPLITYNVTLRFRGVVEEKTYTGGTNDGAFFQIGGTPDGTAWNIYSLVVSNPAQTYYLNRGTSGNTFVTGIDYTKTIQMKGGATITLNALALDGQEIKNQDGSGSNPISISGISSPAQPYNGQFVQMTVISVT